MSWKVISATVGKPIKILSSINPVQPCEVLGILGDCFELEQGALYNSSPRSFNPKYPSLRVELLIIEYRILCGSSFAELVFEFLVWYKTKGSHGASKTPCAIYGDLSLSECYSWARRVEKTIQTFSVDVKFSNLLGVCNDCKKSIDLKDYFSSGAIDLFCCYECRSKIEAGRRLAEEQRKETLRLKRSQKKLKAGISNSATDLGQAKEESKEYMPLELPSPRDVLHWSKELSFTLYKAYRGRCQYCANPQPLCREEAHIEHIIPRAVPLDAVKHRLQNMGVSAEQAENFCSALLPPNHNCVLNYTLSCANHNNKKGGRILHPAALESLLYQAKRKANKVLEIYKELQN